LRTKAVHGLKTGVMVRAEIPKGARKTVHVSRVAVRESGSFNIGKAQRHQLDAWPVVSIVPTGATSPVLSFRRTDFSALGHSRLGTAASAVRLAN
jgi:hypothetical protein